jgi:hypothetical protein
MFAYFANYIAYFFTKTVFLEKKEKNLANSHILGFPDCISKKGAFLRKEQ